MPDIVAQLNAKCPNHQLDRVEAKLDWLLMLHHESDAAQSKLDRILHRLHELKGQIMSLAEDNAAAFKKLDEETTAIAEMQKVLVSKIKNSMTDQEVADLKAGFAALDVRLTGLSVDPTNPVPSPTPAFNALKAKLGK